MRLLPRRRADPELQPPTLPAVDAWQPALGVGHWRTWYAECCDALLAFDRVIATFAAQPLRTGLTARRADLEAAVDQARRLAALGARLEPAGPLRDPRVLRLLAEDPYRNLGPQLGESPTVPLMRALLGIRERLWTVAEQTARLAVSANANPAGVDVPGWLTSLADGIAAARFASWVPTGYTPGPNL